MGQLAKIISCPMHGGDKVKVKSLVTGLDLTKGKEYEVIHEYDTVYELQCDTGRYCRAKEFFEVVEDDNEII